MNVSSRNTLFAGAALLAYIVLGSAASARGCGTSGCGTGPAPAPTPTGRPGAVIGAPLFPAAPGVVVPGTAPHTGSGCCGGRGGSLNITVPGVSTGIPNVTVARPPVAVDSGVSGKTLFSVSEPALVNDQRRERVIFSGGGGAFVDEPAPSSQIRLQSEPERYFETVTEQVPVTEQVCVPQPASLSAKRAVRAVCLDDKGTPHPASRLNKDTGVTASYAGEIYRCMAGTAMQVTVGSFDGKTENFNGGQSISCQKGEALVYNGSALACSKQIEQRDCHERSLLRRFGPGTKQVELKGTSQACVMTTRTAYQSVTRQVERVRATAPQTLNLTGGVGNGGN